MNPTEATFLSPPPGAQPGEFFANLTAELHQHSWAFGIAIALLLLLALGTVLRPAQARPRLRTALLLFCVYVLSIVARAETLTLDAPIETYRWLALLGSMALGFGIISVSALILYDLLARRFGVPRIMR